MIVKNTNINDTGYITIPKGTIAQRPASPSAGMIRYNTDMDAMEYYDGTSWVDFVLGKSAIVREGLVLYLDAGNSISYPGSGTTWYDISGNGNNATLYNSPTFSSGYMNLDGTNQYAVVTANQTSLDFRYEQSITIWMKHSFTSGRRNPWNQAYAGYGTWTHEQGNSINYYYGDGGGNNSPYTSLNSGTTSTGVWNCMTVTRNVSTISWYKNGIFASSMSNPYSDLTLTSLDITIGVGYTGVYWAGQIGNIASYNRALSPSEIQQNFNAMRGRYGL